jgi:hypothetical protein
MNIRCPPRLKPAIHDTSWRLINDQRPTEPPTMTIEVDPPVHDLVDILVRALREGKCPLCGR